MKLGQKDVPIKLKITGLYLEELQKHTWLMAATSGLDAKVKNYKGIIPILLYRWDLECIIDVLYAVLIDEKEYPDRNEERYIRLNELYNYLKNCYAESFGGGFN